MAADNTKIDRVLMIYEQLRSGKAVNKAAAAAEYGVTERSIQRDIDTLRAFFSELAARQGSSAEIVYDRARKDCYWKFPSLAKVLPPNGIANVFLT